jgi:hypothetical protein
MKKGSIGLAISLGVIILLVIFFRVGVVIKNIIDPPKIDPANQAFGKLPPLEFPQSTFKGNYTYTKDTETGALPELPDRLIIYKIVNDPPSLLNLDIVKKKVTALGFIDSTGNPIQEIERGGPSYEWDEPAGFGRKIVYDIVSQNFSMTSDYLQSNTALRADNKPTELSAFATSQSFLGTVDALSKDLDGDKTKNADPKIGYITKPQLFSIVNGDLAPATSLSKSQVIRVDLYQKDIEYTLTAGMSNDLKRFQDFEMKLPILYPHPPYSTMNFYVASGVNEPEVVKANYYHQNINLEQETPATYPIKTSEEAFTELTEGKAYIAANPNNDEQIFITNVFLAYYAADSKEDYLMPIIVFEGSKGFYGYVAAIRDEALE